MKWLRRKKDEETRAKHAEDSMNYSDKLASRMRALRSTEFDNPDDVEARIRRMNYGAKVEHRPAWMEVDEWEARDSA